MAPDEDAASLAELDGVLACQVDERGNVVEVRARYIAPVSR